MANPHNKGRYFENRVAKQIRETLKLSELDVHRNSDSGNASYEFADIRTPYSWIIECKFRNSYNYDRLLKDWDKVIIPIEEQILEEVDVFIKKFKKIPFYTIIMALPRKEVLVTINVNNFYNNDMFKEENIIYNIFDKFAIYKDKILIVTLSDLLMYIIKKNKEKS